MAWRAAALVFGLWLLPAPTNAQADFPHAPISLPDGGGEAEFHMMGDFAVITLRRPGAQVVPLKIVSDANDALAILADRRLSFAWPALLAWTGDDLTKLRDRTLARSKSSVEIGLPGAPPKMSLEMFNGDAGLSATLQYARVLRESGQYGEAVALLRQQLATATGEVGKTAREFMTIRLANMLFEEGDEAAAIAMLEKESADSTRTPRERQNLDINLAAILARSGHYQRAFVLINQVWLSFDQDSENGDQNFKVPESEANFAWIKACALDGLGSRDKARALLAGISTDASPMMPGTMTTGAGARLQFFSCRHDAVGLAREFVAQLAKAPTASSLFLMLQPSSPRYGPDRAVLAAALKQRDLADAVARSSRALEPQFTPAVTGWRDRPATPPAP